MHILTLIAINKYTTKYYFYYRTLFYLLISIDLLLFLSYNTNLLSAICYYTSNTKHALASSCMSCYNPTIKVYKTFKVTHVISDMNKFAPHNEL